MTAEQFNDFMQALHGSANAMERLSNIDEPFEFKCKLSEGAVKRWRGGKAKLIIDVSLASVSLPAFYDDDVELRVPIRNFFEVWRLGAFEGCSLAVARADGSVGFNCIWRCGNGGFQSVECVGNTEREREMCFALAEKRCRI